MEQTRRRQGTRQGWESVLIANAGTFLKAPAVAPAASAIKASGCRVVVFGLPFDSTTIARPGAQLGPRAIRDASCHFLSYHAEFEVDLFDELGIVDAGDVEVVPGNAQATLDRCADLVGEVLDAGALPVFFGGEHVTTIGGTWGVDRHRPGKYGLIMFDTHLDTAQAVGGERLNHCCPITRAMELGSFDPSKCVIIGPHGAMNPKAEVEYARHQGITVFSVRDVERLGPAIVAEQALAKVAEGTDGVYLSVDMDCLNSAESPGTCVPTLGGLTGRELLRMLEVVGRGNLVCMDLTEVNPAYDSGITAMGACQVIVDTLAAYAIARRSN